MNKVFRYRIYPNKTQKVFLEKQFGCCRFVYNKGIDYAKLCFVSDQPFCKYTHCNQIPNLKENYPFLKDVNGQALQQATLNGFQAFKNFWGKRAGFPKYKSKRDNWQSFRIPQYFEFTNNYKKIRFPKLKNPIKVVYKGARIEGKIKFVDFTKTASDEYYISVCCEISIDNETKCGGIIGIDLGLIDIVTTSEGEKIKRQHCFKPLEDRLSKAQQKHVKKKKGSKNRNKARIKVAKIHQKIRNKRLDYIHKLTSYLVKKNQINTLCLESLNVKEMLESNRSSMSKSIQDVSWFELIKQLQYKTKWCGKRVVFVNPHNTSKKCNICGNIKEDLSLSQRSWKCGFCNTLHDRDINAAINIRNSGMKLLNKAA